MFVSMMEHRSPRSGVTTGRAHSNHHYKHYLNRHHQQHQNQIQQQQIQYALANNNNVPTKAIGFPVLQIEDKLKNRAKLSYVPQSNSQNGVNKPTANSAYDKSSQDISGIEKILLNKDSIKEKEIRRKNGNTVNSHVKEIKNCESSYNRNPYDRVSLAPKNANDITKSARECQLSKSENPIKYEKVRTVSREEFEKMMNIGSNLRISKGNPPKKKHFEKGLNSTETSKVSYIASALQKSLAKEELVKCRNSAKDLLNIGATRNTNLNLLQQDAQSSSIYSSFPTLLDEVELKRGRRSSSQQRYNRDRSLPYAIYIKSSENDYYEVEIAPSHATSKIDSCKKDFRPKRTEKKARSRRSALELLERDLLNVENHQYSDDSDIDDKHRFNESRSFPASPAVTHRQSECLKNKSLDSEIVNNDKQMVKHKTSAIVINNNKNIINPIVDETNLSNSKPLVKGNRMVNSEIQLRQHKSPISSPSFLSDQTSKDRIECTVSPKTSLDQSRTIDHPSTSLSSNGCVYAPARTNSAIPMSNSVSLINLTKIGNVQNERKVPAYIAERRNRAMTQLYESAAFDSPQISRRKKLSMRFRGGRQPNSKDTGLIRSKSQSRANLNILTDDTKQELSASQQQSAFLANRSKTSVNLSVVMSTTPSSCSPLPYLIKPNFAIRKRANSAKRTRMISNDQSMILGVFDPIENDRKRAIMRDYALVFARDKIGFEVAQQELKAFGRLKELGIGKTRVLRIADLPGVEQIHSTQILKKYLILQRPKKKALHEYYNDDDAELEAMAKMVDPNAPKPTGSLITPVRGDFPSNSSTNFSINQIPKTMDSILHRYGTTQPKAVAGIILDVFGKASVSLTYGKLHSRATKIAYMLLSKQVTIITSGVKEKVHLCLPGDRVALVYPNTEPLAFLSAFYGCLLAGVVPVPIEVPLTKRDAGIQQFGFLLGSCGVRVALTSESCLKGLPKVGSQTSGTQGNTGGSSSVGVSSSPFSGSGAQSASSSALNNFHHSNSSFPSSTTGSGGSGGGSAVGSNYYNHYTSSTNPNDVADFKGWPRLHWVVTENLSKPTKDWTLPSLLVNDEHAYIEYTTDREGSIKGVCVSRQAMLNHCRAIVSSMGYKEGEIMVCVLDFKRDVGLWHGILSAIYSGMRVHFVPYSLMKINPTSWLTQVTKFQANAALVKSRDLHWSLMASSNSGIGTQNTNNKEPLNLSSLRVIVVADGANPWSLSSCDQFLAVFRSLGLRSDVLCPCAGSPETGIVSLRRSPTVTNDDNTETAAANGDLSTTVVKPRSGRGILSMLALSHSVVRVDQDNSLTSLTLQDAGQVIPGGMAIVVKPTGPPKLCKVDEVGEICLHAPSTASCYLGLKGVSQQTFTVSPLGADDRPIGPVSYVRSGLIGFLGPNGLVFVIGNKSAMLSVSGRQHSADDIIATVLAVEPMKFVYRGRIAVFSVNILRDERICIVAEQKPDVSEEDAFNWMVRVLHAVDSIHQVGIYCLALLLPNQMPKTPLGGIHVTETRQRFLDGCLHPTTVLMCPQNCVLNLPKPREPQSQDVGPAAMFVGNIVQGARIAGAQGRELSITNDEMIFLIDILRQRAVQTPDHVLYTMVNAKGIEIDSLSCHALLKKAERIGALLLDKGRLSAGDHVALIFPPGVELISAFYGCLTVGLVPVCIRAPSATNLHASLITVRMVVDVSKSVALLSNSTMIKLLKSKEASSHRLNTKAWPTILDIDDAPSSSVARRQKINNGTGSSNGRESETFKRPTDPCYLDFSVSTTGQLAGVVVTNFGVISQCKSLKMACELYPSRDVTLCLDPYCGLGFALWCLSNVYSGHHSTLISPVEVEQNPAIWLTTISNNKVRDTFCSYSVMEMCVRELAPQIQQLKEKGINLSCVRTCVAVAEERPRVQLCNAFIKMLAPLGLAARTVSTSFGARVNSTICMQGASSPDPSTLYVDARALRNDRVTLVEKGAPHSIPLMESGKLLPGVKVVIANPETKGQCADSHLGEIWVASSHNAAGYFSIFGEETHLQTDHFNARLKTGNTKTTFARTGYLGFLHQTQSITADGELHDAVFVVGALDETLMLRGMRYHPVDIETTVIRSHKRIVESAVFTWTHLLVVVAETSAPESEALDLVSAITSSVLEEQHLIVGVVMIIDPATIPINSRGEKQRMHLRDAFLKDQLDPIYVAYNM